MHSEQPGKLQDAEAQHHLQEVTHVRLPSRNRPYCTTR